MKADRAAIVEQVQNLALQTSNLKPDYESKKSQLVDTSLRGAQLKREYAEQYEKLSECHILVTLCAYAQRVMHSVTFCLCVCLCVRVCDQKCPHTLTGRMSSCKECILLAHPLYMSPKIFARVIESYRECYSLRSYSHDCPPGVSGNFLKHCSKKPHFIALPTNYRHFLAAMQTSLFHEIAKPTLWLDRITGKPTQTRQQCIEIAVLNSLSTDSARCAQSMCFVEL